jgi:hypothetical protein
MLLGFYWSRPYVFKTLINDLKLGFSQIGSFDVLKEFKNCICKFIALLCEFGAFSFWWEWDVHKIVGKLERFPQLMCRI